MKHFYAMAHKLFMLMCMLAVVPSAFAQDEKEVVKIGTADEFVAFAERVNAGEVALDAELTADIDISGTNAMVGIAGNVCYRGNFNGNFHTITVNYDTEDEYCAVFPYVSGASIKNVGTTGTITTTNHFASGLVGRTQDGAVNIESCWSDVTINTSFEGDGTHGGLVSVADAPTHLKYCAFTGAIIGESTNCCGGIVGWIANGSSTMTGCYVNATFEIDLNGNSAIFHRNNDSGTMKDCFAAKSCYDKYSDTGIALNGATLALDESLANGKICFLLNGSQSTNSHWYQTIGEDAAPVLNPDHGTVYRAATRHCPNDDGLSLGFTNTFVDENAIEYPDHKYLDDHFCEFCHTLDANYSIEPAADGVYELRTAADIAYFARLVNSGEEGMNHLNARLMNDIDYSGHTEQIGSNASEANTYYKGTFDGQFHVVTLNSTVDKEFAGPIFCALGNGGIIKNLGTTGTLTHTGSGYRSAGIVAFTGTSEIHTATIINCWSDVTFDMSAFSGDATNGGICAIADAQTVFDGCYFVGQFVGENAKNCGGILGWSNRSTTSMNRCFVAAEFNIDTEEEGGSAIFNRHADYCRHTDCYYFDAMEGYETLLNEGIPENEMFVSGAMAFLFNNMQTEGDDVVWYQTINEDYWPTHVASRGVVYPASCTKLCPNDPDAEFSDEFTNTPTEITYTYPNHDLHDGFCSICNTIDPSITIQEDADGYYEIANAAQLVLFAEAVNAGKTDAKAKITADITMTEGMSFPCIGTLNNWFGGEIDGQFHTIELAINRSNNNVGLIAYAGNGLNIKNLGISGYVHGASYVGAFIGVTKGDGRLDINNCWTVADVVADGANAGGFVGCHPDGGPFEYYITNCAVGGSITGGRESAAISGWCGRVSHYTNVVSFATVAGVDGDNTFNRNTAGMENCWEMEGYGRQVGNYFAEEDLASGILTYRLNVENTSETAAWRQNLGEDETPVLLPSHKIVYAQGAKDCPDSELILTGEFSNEAGEITIGDHDFTYSPLCSFCGNPNLDKDEDGFYLAGTPEDLNVISFAFQDGLKNLKFKLTADIDLNDSEEIFIPIGSEQFPFRGIVDGQFHTVTVAIDNPNEKKQGLFGVVGSGTEISNLGVKGFVNAAEYAGGIVGSSVQESGFITFTNCWNEADVTVNGANAAGIIGVSMGGAMAFRMTNCYTTGHIKGGRESAALTGWCGSGSQFTNCFNFGYIEGRDGTHTLWRNSPNVTNVATVDTQDSDQGLLLPESMFASGELVAMFGEPWRQTINVDATPVLYRASAEVLTDEDGNFYNEAEGALNVSASDKWDIVVLTAGTTVPSGVRAFTCPNGEGDELPIVRVDKMESYTPYLVYAENGVNTTFNGKNYLSQAEKLLIEQGEDEDYNPIYATVYNVGALNGTIAALNAPTGSYVMKAGVPTVVADNEEVEVAPYKGYITFKSNAETLKLDATTGIKNIMTSADDADKVYDLQGRRVAKPVKGIYVKKGKKVIVK